MLKMMLEEEKNWRKQGVQLLSVLSSSSTDTTEHPALLKWFLIY